MSRKHKPLCPAHEAFCQAFVLFGGGYGAGAHAYRKAHTQAENYPDQQVAESASALLRKPKIQARIAQLRSTVQEIADRNFGACAEKVLQQLAAIGFASLEHFIAIDDDGNLEVDIGSADVSAIRGLQQIKVTKRIRKQGQGALEVAEIVEVEIKLPERMPALAKLGQHLGLFEKPGGKKSRSAASPADLEERLRNACERVGKARTTRT